MNSHPSSASTRSIVLDGGGAPATTMRTVPRPGTSRPSLARVSAAPRIAATTAGAAHRSVTPWRSMRDRISSPSILRSTTCAPPMPVTAYGIPQPLQWNIGRVCSSTSRSLTPVCHPNMAALSQQFRWVSWTPFGRAVVPDV